MRVARVTTDWRTIQSLNYPKKFPNGAMHWVDDKSITECLESRHFEDVSKDINRQPGTHNHAARVATLVTMLRAGVELKRIHVHISDKHLNFEDGNHRLRAHLYLFKNPELRLYITGNIEVWTLSTYDVFHYRGRLSQVRELTR